MTKTVISMFMLLSLNLSAEFIVDHGQIEYYESASDHYTSACENGDRNRCVDLGVLYFTGNGVEQSHEKAEELFTKACKKKHAKACYHLGSLYKRGSNSSEKEHSQASYALILAPKPDAKGIKKNLTRSKKFYALGCMYGYAQSCDQYDLIKEKADANSSDVENNSYRYYTDEIW